MDSTKIIWIFILSFFNVIRDNAVSAASYCRYSSYYTYYYCYYYYYSDTGTIGGAVAGAIVFAIVVVVVIIIIYKKKHRSTVVHNVASPNTVTTVHVEHGHGPPQPGYGQPQPGYGQPQPGYNPYGQQPHYGGNPAYPPQY
ncbi:comitin-like isoform X2 [Saccostrea cucullata]|uniref:comitin-like isoform X2 n=1 Tax=Saccostrea cuccullata TaxID=36930 RepID=UPI002ED47D30